MLLNGIKIIRGSGLPIRGQQKQATKKILKIMVRRIKHTAEPFTHFFNPVHDCISMYMQFLGRQSQALSVFQIDKLCFYIVGLIVYIVCHQITQKSTDIVRPLFCGDRGSKPPKPVVIILGDPGITPGDPGHFFCHGSLIKVTPDLIQV